MHQESRTAGSSCWSLWATFLPTPLRNRRTAHTSTSSLIFLRRGEGESPAAAPKDNRGCKSEHYEAHCQYATSTYRTKEVNACPMLLGKGFGLTARIWTASCADTSLHPLKDRESKPPCSHPQRCCQSRKPQAPCLCIHMATGPKTAGITSAAVFPVTVYWFCYVYLKQTK